MAASDKSKSKRPQYLVEGEKIPLDYPFRLNGRDITEVTILPPSYSDLIALSGRHVDSAILVAILVSEPEDVVLALKWSDIERVLDKGMIYLPPNIVSLILSKDDVHHKEDNNVLTKIDSKCDFLFSADDFRNL